MSLSRYLRVCVYRFSASIMFRLFGRGAQGYRSHNGEKAVDIGGQVEETVVRLGKSSAGTTRPASASRMPSSMAARVSSSSWMGAGSPSSNFFALPCWPEVASISAKPTSPPTPS